MTNVLVDTSVWSLALRRRTGQLSNTESKTKKELVSLIEEGRVTMLGIIRQELLSGVKSAPAFQSLCESLRAFPDSDLGMEDYEEAARACNTCRAAGIAGSTVDFLICGVAMRRKMPIFTLDQDFSRYSKHLTLSLHQIRKSG